MKAVAVVPWVTQLERDAFLGAWGLSKYSALPSFLHFQQDKHKDGCGATKNAGIGAAVDAGADVVVVLDGDCYPSEEAPTLEHLMQQHVVALTPQHVKLYDQVTAPASRGTPYYHENFHVLMPVAASMGFWTNVPDYCAVRQLALQEPMTFRRETVFGRYFPLCGMNLAFRPAEWFPWCQFIEVDRFDDIWMGWLFQKEAYRRGYCFNLAGPLVHHSRQSNVWRNLASEARFLEETETLWRKIALAPQTTYGDLLPLLPAGTRGLKIR
jgi:hypothetical protein